jgi:hypothetical protein
MVICDGLPGINVADNGRLRDSSNIVPKCAPQKYQEGQGLPFERWACPNIMSCAHYRHYKFCSNVNTNYERWTLPVFKRYLVILRRGGGERPL